jgi:putative hemolysin
VHPDHRTGAVVNLMWAGIARYLHLNNLRWLGGCASVPLDDGGTTRPASGPGAVQAPVAARAAGQARGQLAAAQRAGRRPKVQPPALLKGYLRLGSWVCGEPAYDPDFNVADFYVLFSMDRLDPRYRRHFLGADAMARCCGSRLRLRRPVPRRRRPHAPRGWRRCGW